MIIIIWFIETYLRASLNDSYCAGLDNEFLLIVYLHLFGKKELKVDWPKITIKKYMSIKDETRIMTSDKIERRKRINMTDPG